MSQMRILIQRAESASANRVPYVVALYNYIKHFDDYTKEEYERARELMSNIGMDISPVSDESVLARYYGPSHRWKKACVRCGKVMNGNSTMKRGMGPSCYDVVGDGIIKDMRPLPSAFTVEPKKVSAMNFIKNRRKGVAEISRDD